MRFTSMAVGLTMAVALAGCQRTSYSPGIGEPYTPPLQAQPVPQVQSGALPPPTGAPGVPGQYPTAPNANMASVGGGGVGAAPPTNALDVTKESMVGNWRVSSGGASCDMFLTLTNLGSGSRGGTRGCVGELTAMGSWEVSGKSVILKDRSGNPIGRVYKSADARYDGSTNGGQSVSLSR